MTKAILNAAEKKAIDKAASAIAYLSSATNWSDEGAWQEAIRLERKQGLPAPLAKAKAIEAWHKGATNPDMPVRDMFHMRPGYLRAFLLGVRHRVERADHDYNGPMFNEALCLCPAALEAFRTVSKRWTD